MKAVLLLTLCFVATGQAVKVVDGDTFDAVLRIWSTVSVHERVRVYGVDTPELKGETKDAAVAAASFTQAWLARGAFDLRTCGRDAFGRVLGIVSRGGEGVLAQDLITAGHGVPYRAK